ncbi:MAG: PEGA domain-containing protein [Oligoflexales bacterium]|nr:PEGA domain-containing protein [Oligoflexales bacterium]
MSPSALHLYSKLHKYNAVLALLRFFALYSLMMAFSQVGQADPVLESQKFYDAMKFREAEELLYRSIPKANNSNEKSKMYLLLGVIKYQQNRKQSANQYFELALKLNSRLELKNIKHVDSGIYAFFGETKSTLFPKLATKENAPVPPQKKPEIKPKAKTILAPRLSPPVTIRKAPPTPPPQIKKPPPIIAKAKEVSKKSVQPAPIKKTLLFVVSPQIDAMISQDGIIIGKANTALEVKAGQFQIEVASPGFVSQKLLVEVKNQQTLKINVSLNKQQAPKPVIAAATPTPKRLSSSKAANNGTPMSAKANKKMNLANSTQNKPNLKKAASKKTKPLDPFAEKPIKYQKPAPNEPSIADEFNRDQQATQTPQVTNQGGYVPLSQTNPAPYPQQTPYGQQGQVQYAPQPLVQQPPNYGYQQMPAPTQIYPAPAPIYQAAPSYQTPQTYGAPPPPPVIIDQRSLQGPAQSNTPLPNTGMQQGPDTQQASKIKSKSVARSQKSLSGSDHFFNLLPFGIAQFRNKQFGLGAAFAAGQIASLYYYYSLDQEITSTTNDTNKILAEREAEWKTLPEDQKDAHLAETEKFRNDRVSYQSTLTDQSMMGIYGFIGLWGLNIATSYLYPAKPKRLGLLEWQISDGISLAFNPHTDSRLIASGFKTDLHFRKINWQEHTIKNFLSIETTITSRNESIAAPQNPVLYWKIESDL